jgi:hypothetical protein
LPFVYSSAERSELLVIFLLFFQISQLRMGNPFLSRFPHAKQLAAAASAVAQITQ